MPHQSFFQVLADSTPDALIATDIEGTVVFWSHAASRLLGYTREEAVGKRLDELVVAPSHRQDTATEIRGGGASFESELRTKEGVHLDVSISRKVVSDQVEDFVVTAVRDVTDARVRHQAQLLEARFRDVLEKTPDAIVIVNRAGRVVLMNGQAEQLFGYARGELLGQPVEVLLPTSFRSRHADQRAGYVAQPRKRPMGAGLELFGLRRDGTEFPVDISLSPMEVEGLSVTVSAIRDVSLRVQTERALREANAELESFAYSVSHDLRTPLRAVDGFSQALVEDYAHLLPPEARELLGFIREGAQRMSVLIDDLLEFSRLSRQPLKKQDVDMGSLASAAWSELGPQKGEREIDIRIGDLAACQGDVALLRQVWLNLLSNALKYTRSRDHAVIEVGCQTEDGRPVYYVRDNGVGFDMRYVRRLFGVFQRLHRAEDYEGTGVGLAIVARILHRHGGRAWASAEVEKGATFSFSLQGGRQS